MWYEKGIQISKFALAIIGGAFLGAIIGAAVGLGYANFFIAVPSDCFDKMEARKCIALGLGQFYIIVFAAISGAASGTIVMAYGGSFRGLIHGLIVVSLGGTVIAGLVSNAGGALYGAIISTSVAILVGLVGWLITWAVRRRHRMNNEAIFEQSFE